MLSWGSPWWFCDALGSRSEGSGTTLCLWAPQRVERRRDCAACGLPSEGRWMTPLALWPRTAQRHHARVSSPASDVIRAIAPDLFWNAAGGGGVFFLGTNSGGGGRRPVGGGATRRGRGRGRPERETPGRSRPESRRRSPARAAAFNAARAQDLILVVWLICRGGRVYQEDLCRLDGV